MKKPHLLPRRSPPIVLSWNSWNWPLTKRSTKLDFPTADSPNSTSLNWQILFPALGPLGLVAPPRLAMTFSDPPLSLAPNPHYQDFCCKTQDRKQDATDSSRGMHVANARNKHNNYAQGETCFIFYIGKANTLNKTVGQQLRFCTLVTLPTRTTSPRTELLAGMYQNVKSRNYTVLGGEKSMQTFKLTSQEVSKWHNL